MFSCVYEIVKKNLSFFLFFYFLFFYFWLLLLLWVIVVYSVHLSDVSSV